MTVRTHCPSCNSRITPLVLECRVCGLSLARQPLPRPLLFQASALRRTGPIREERQTLSTPALGRVEPLAILERVPLAGPQPEPAAAPALPVDAPAAGAGPGLADTFWPVAKMEALEGLMLLALNGMLVLVACWMSGGAPSRVYPLFWPYLLPVHTAVSWAYLMVPLVLVGQSPMMGMEGLLMAIAASLLEGATYVAVPDPSRPVICPPQTRVRLQGDGSSDPDGRVVSYHWLLLEAPAAAQFQPDERMRRILSDGVRLGDGMAKAIAFASRVITSARRGPVS